MADPPVKVQPPNVVGEQHLKAARPVNARLAGNHSSDRKHCRLTPPSTHQASSQHGSSRDSDVVGLRLAHGETMPSNRSQHYGLHVVGTFLYHHLSTNFYANSQDRSCGDAYTPMSEDPFRFTPTPTCVLDGTLAIDMRTSRCSFTLAPTVTGQRLHLAAVGRIVGGRPLRRARTRVGLRFTAATVVVARSVSRRAAPQPR